MLMPESSHLGKEKKKGNSPVLGRFGGVVVITFALHAKGRGIVTRSKYFFDQEWNWRKGEREEGKEKTRRRQRNRKQRVRRPSKEVGTPFVISQLEGMTTSLPCLLCSLLTRIMPYIL